MDSISVLSHQFCGGTVICLFFIGNWSSDFVWPVCLLLVSFILISVLNPITYGADTTHIPLALNQNNN